MFEMQFETGLTSVLTVTTSQKIIEIVAREIHAREPMIWTNTLKQPLFLSLYIYCGFINVLCTVF